MSLSLNVCIFCNDAPCVCDDDRLDVDELNYYASRNEPVPSDNIERDFVPLTD